MGFRILNRIKRQNLSDTPVDQEASRTAFLKAESLRWSAATGRDPSERLAELTRKLHAMRANLTVPQFAENIASAIELELKDTKSDSMRTLGKVDIATLLELL